MALSASDDYKPGLLSDILEQKANAKKNRKRKLNDTDGTECALFKKYNNSEKHAELPVGQTKLDTKKFHSNDAYNETSNEPQIRKYNKSKSSGDNRKKERKMSMNENERTVFVGNVPLGTTRKEIKKLFKQFGKIESVRLRSVVAGRERTSKKVAVLTNCLSDKVKSLIFYVKFESQESVRNALSLNGEKLGDHTLRVDGCVGTRHYNGHTTVFVGNIPKNAREDELSEHFKTAGEVSFVRLVRDPKTGDGRGFGFVGFENKAFVPIALNLDGSKFGGRVLRVKKLIKKNVQIRAQQRLKKASKNSQLMKSEVAAHPKELGRKSEKAVNPTKTGKLKHMSRKVGKEMHKKKLKQSHKSVMS